MKHGRAVLVDGIPIGLKVAYQLAIKALSDMGMYKGVLCVNGQLLPPPAAARKIVGTLLKGRRVIVQKGVKSLVVQNMRQLIKLALRT